MQPLVATRVEDRACLTETKSTVSCPASPATRSVPPGLLNVGNTCYLNSVLQVLYHIPRFRSSILRYIRPPDSEPIDLKTSIKHDVTCTLQQVFIALDKAWSLPSQSPEMPVRDVDYVSPEHMVNLLRKRRNVVDFNAEGQQDAHEFLRFLLDTVSSALRDTSPINSAPATIAPKPVETRREKPPAKVVHPRPTRLKLSRSSDQRYVGNLSPQTRCRSPFQPSPRSPKRRRHWNNTKVLTDRFAESALPLANGDSLRFRSKSQFCAHAASEEIVLDGSNRSPPSSEPAPTSKLQAEGFCDPNIVRNVFQGECAMSTECFECETVSVRRESILDVSVPIVLGRSLSASFSAMRDGGDGEDWLRGNNKYACATCNTETEARRRVFISKIPPVFTVHLMLFQFADQPGGSKIPVATPCPIRMKFTRWCTEACTERDAAYRLTAVIVHAGGCSSSGHYYTYIYKSQSRQWFLFDDSLAVPVTEATMRQRLFTSPKSKTTSYLLFYTREDE